MPKKVTSRGFESHSYNQITEELERMYNEGWAIVSQYPIYESYIDGGGYSVNKNGVVFILVKDE